MRYNLFGSTGLLVSELCLGTMTFGQSGLFGQLGGLDQAQAEHLVRIGLDAGVNFFDTADVYSDGESEALLGQALRNLGVRRDEVVVATKAFGPTGKGANQRGASRYHLLQAIDDSLRRLQLDHIDLYQIHGWDELTPLEEVMRALDALVQSGKVRYVGVSNWAAWRIATALGIARAEGLAPIQSVQAYYSLAGRDVEREIAPLATSANLAIMTWSPLAGGYLSGKYSGSVGGRRDILDFPPVDKDRAATIVDLLRGMAEQRGASVPQIALSWLLHQRPVTSVIVGARTEAQLRDNLGCTAIDLEDAELRALEAASALTPEYPAWMAQVQAGMHGSWPSPRRR